MKELTKREAMEILLAGGKIIYWHGAVKGQHNPLRWDETRGVVDKDGYPTTLNVEKLTEYKEPKKGSCWVNIHPIGPTSYDTRENADYWSGSHRLACIEVKWTEGEGL